MKNLCLALALLLALAGCDRGKPAPQPVELKHFPLDSMEGVRATTGVLLDPAVSSDGKGSLRIDAKEAMTVPLFEVTGGDLDNSTLLYQASVQSEKLDGKAYLEMWVRFPGKGEFFSRGLDQTVTGSMSWKTMTIPFFLKSGERPDLIRLNLVVNGKGRVWIDDIRLLRAPLPGR
ncbi:MAG: hypothetical protein LAN37_06280 [Acidobacteriia bacterium]|nr:hypothetical protein [Terriglobia bacterium]